MTIKEISELTGKTEKTVRMWISQEQNVLMQEQKVLTKGHAKNYNLDEVIAILRAGKVSDGIISILKENAEMKNKPVESSSNNVSNQNTEIILKYIDNMEKRNQQFMTIVLDKLENITKKQLPVIEVKQDYYSLVGYMKIKGIQSVTISELQKFGKMATKLSRENGKEIRRVPDERYGEVNSYHINILDNVFMF